MKRTVSITAAIVFSASILSLQSNAMTLYTSSDANLLNDYVIGKNDGISKDINNDGLSDVFDMVQLRKYMTASTGKFSVQNYQATEDNVKLTGRNLRKSDITWLTQSGSSSEFVLNGKSAQITIAGDDGINNGENYRPRYAVYINDVLLTDSIMSTNEKTIQLFDNEKSASVKVKVILLSEAMYGAVGIKNISVNTDSNIPIMPVQKKNLSIEFIGDSITCAYGVEGLSNSDSFKTTTENFTKSYAYLTAQKLNADYSAVSYSGHGIISGYTSSGDKNTESLIPPCYGLVSKFKDYSVDWDFSKHKNDVVVINLGTNDSSYVTASDKEKRSEEFIAGYVSFLKTVREKNPDSYIICTLGTMGCDEVYALVEKSVAQYSTAANDKKIMSYHSVTQNASDGYGSDWHPSAVTQQNSAYVLADKICQVLGIESDQVGLNVVADAKYDVKIDSNMGGNAASYVGYDKSFWINMVSGGKSPEAIEAVLSEFSLKKGGKYRLEFDYTSTVDATVPVIIRNSTKSAEFFKDEISAVSSKAHYSKEFVCSGSTADAEIVFQLGGKDYYNVTLSNIKLVKIA